MEPNHLVPVYTHGIAYNVTCKILKIAIGLLHDAAKAH